MRAPIPHPDTPFNEKVTFGDSVHKQTQYQLYQQVEGAAEKSVFLTISIAFIFLSRSDGRQNINVASMTSFIVAGGMGAVVSHYLHSTAASLPTLDRVIAELGMVIQPFNGLRMLLPALFGFFGGTLLLLVWNFIKVRMVRYLLECNSWFLKPKHPINQVRG